ncbi:MAG TPA: hypothetical protein VGD98_07235 [Ktedonobacteraceae bacterium]
MTELLPEEQHFLDEAVERLKQTRQTFTERTALEAARAAGYDLQLSYDARFVKASARNGQIDPHYRLREQTLANRRIFNDLMAESWDGHDLTNKLAALDEEEGGQHVLYPYDKDLLYRQGRWEPTREQNLKLTEDQKAELDTCRTALMQSWASEDYTPWTLQHILAALKQADWAGATESNAVRVARAWLLANKQILRVGQDLWLPAEKLPDPVKRTRLQMLPIRAMRSEDMQELDEVFASAPSSSGAASKGYKPFAAQSADPVVVGGELASMSAQWTTTLRTINILESFLSIPAKARAVYPPVAPVEHTDVLLDALWYEDGEHFWLWLDRQQHRLYGSGLLNKIAWERDPGDVLHVMWAPDVITISISGHNEQVQQEEARLVDRETLKELRGSLGEAYRDSMQRLLSMNPAGMTRQEIMLALRERLGHTVHHGTVLALLSRGGFVKREQRWFAAPDNAAARRSLRTTLIATMVPHREDLAEAVPSLSEQIHRQTQAIIRRLDEIEASSGSTRMASQ